MFYVDNPIDGVPCNAYFYDNDGWYYWKGMALTEEGRWEKADAHAKALYDANMDRHICPKHAEQYRDRRRVRLDDSRVCKHKPDWSKV